MFVLPFPYPLCLAAGCNKYILSGLTKPRVLTCPEDGAGQEPSRGSVQYTGQKKYQWHISRE